MVIRQSDLAAAFTDGELPVFRENTSALRSMEIRLEHSDPKRMASDYAIARADVMCDLNRISEKNSEPSHEDLEAMEIAVSIGTVPDQTIRM